MKSKMAIAVEGREVAQSKLKHLEDMLKLDPIDRIEIGEAGTSSETVETSEEWIEKVKVYVNEERLMRDSIQELRDANKRKEVFQNWYIRERSKPFWKERYVNDTWEKINQAAAGGGTATDKDSVQQ